MSSQSKKISYKLKFITENYTRIKSPVFRELRDDCFTLLEAVFSQKSVIWGEINIIAQSILVYHEGSFENRAVKNYFAKKGISGQAPAVSRAYYGDTCEKKIKFYRVGNVVTNWEMAHELPSRLRLRHPLLVRRKLICTQIEKVLLSIPGVENCQASNLTGSVVVNFKKEQVNKETLVRLIDEVFTTIGEAEKEIDGKKIGQFERSSAVFAFALAFPELALISIPATILVGLPIFKNAYEAIKARKIKVDILDTVVIAGSLAANQPGIASFMVWVVSLADKIKENTSESTKKMLSDIFNTQPKFAWLKKGGQEVQVSVHGLKKDDEIVVHTGEAVPIDGKIIDGKALIDQSALTGESQPVERIKGESALACTTVISGQINVSVQTTGDETIAGKIQKIIAEVSQHKTKAQSKGEEIADKAVLPTLALGGLGLALGGPGTALAVVNCDYGTGIRVAAPTLLLTHLVRLAKQGILVKNGAALDKLLKVDVFLFDKTGTLTHEVPKITGIISLAKDFSEKKILEYAATAEQRMSHPIARAIIEEAQKHHLVLSNQKNGEKCKIGLGVEVTIGEDNVKVGSVKYLAGENINVPTKVKRLLDDIKKEGQSAVMVGINNAIVGIIKLKTVPREDSVEVVKFLKSKGVKKVVLLSGDHQEVVAATAKEIGADDYIAEVMPHEKADWVKKYKNEGKVVAMVGDGVNDGPALSLADVSISLRGASDIAIDTAHIIFLDGDFSKIHLLFENAHNFNKGVWSSFKLIAVPNSICIAGALTGFWGLGMSLVMNNLFNVIATVKSLAPLYAAVDINEPKLLPVPSRV